VRFAALCLQLQEEDILAMADRLRLPNEYRELGVLAAEFGHAVHEAADMDAGLIMDLLDNTDALRRPDRFLQFLLACEADARAQDNVEEYRSAAILLRALNTAKQVDAKALADSGLQGPELGEAIRQQRVEAIRLVMKHERD
jgi:tRNA nucleotidyltransferase (CCA-adding enzyme)